MLTIGQLASRFGLSRSTLLYYDSIGLLSPSSRSPSNYRLYSDDDVARMELIDVYRRAGLPLKEIQRALAPDAGSISEVFEARLRSLNRQIGKLRRQQQRLVALMQDGDLLADRPLDKERWVSILRATGLNDREMHRWHVEFERISPEGHRDFLESLGLDDAEVVRIRDFSRSSSETS